MAKGMCRGEQSVFVLEVEQEELQLYDYPVWEVLTMQLSSPECVAAIVLPKASVAVAHLNQLITC